MKTVACVSLAVVLALGVSVPAHASTIQFIDTFMPASTVTLDDTGDSFSFSHDITPPVAPTNSLEAYVDGVLTAGEGYDSATDTLSSGTLTLSFFNPTSPPDTSGQFDVVLDGSTFLDNFNFAVTVGPASFNVSLITLGGLLAVELTRTNAAGSVDFTKSVLDVSGTREMTESPPPGPVPEPASLLLVGGGLLGLAVRARSRRQAARH